MEPILTLPYSEWLVAEHLMRALPSREGYSVYAPLSRQEKGVDLLLAKRTGRVTRVATLQVKYSRAYEGRPGAELKFVIWFRSFAVPEQADFIILAALYPNVTGRGGGKKASWWLPVFLLFSNTEMADFIRSLRTRSGGIDRMFYFAFDTPERVIQTRGAAEKRDFTAFTFANRLAMLRKHLGAA